MRNFFKKFRKVIQKIINVQIGLVLTIVYFVFITPFGIFIRLFKDYLKINLCPFWQVRRETLIVSDFLKKQ